MALNKAKLLAKKNLTTDVTELIFQSENLIFQAGQFVTFKVTDGKPTPCFRAYSIASKPDSDKNFEICVKVVENGRGSNWLNNLPPDSEVEFLGPNGKFFLNENSTKNILFIATGTGIAPIKALLEDQLAKGDKRNMQLLFGLRHIGDIFYEEEFKDFAAKYPNFSYDITLSRPENDSWIGKTGHVTDHLQTMQIDPQNTEAYICGLKAMIEDVQQILTAKGLPDEAVHFEKYD